jgi:pre-mRNA-splicing factor CWC22
VTLTEDATTSSSRIFLKTLFQDLSEIMGLIALNKRLQDPTLAQFYDGIFPKVRHPNVSFVTPIQCCPAGGLGYSSA